MRSAGEHRAGKTICLIQLISLIELRTCGNDDVERKLMLTVDS